jgi:ribose transport system permease protein
MTVSEVRSEEDRGKGLLSQVRQLLRLREMTLLLLVGGCGIIFSLTVPNFGSLGNFLSIGDSLVFDAMITTGMTIALVSGGFDLSVGSVFASSGVIVAVAMVAGLSMWLSIIIALLTAAAWGLLNGFVITKVGVNPLLTTLATMGTARGFVYIVTEGRCHRVPRRIYSAGPGRFRWRLGFNRDCGSGRNRRKASMYGARAPQNVIQIGDNG